MHYSQVTQLNDPSRSEHDDYHWMGIFIVLVPEQRDVTYRDSQPLVTCSPASTRTIGIPLSPALSLVYTYPTPHTLKRNCKWANTAKGSPTQDTPQPCGRHAQIGRAHV